MTVLFCTSAAVAHSAAAKPAKVKQPAQLEQKSAPATVALERINSAAHRELQELLGPDRFSTADDDLRGHGADKYTLYSVDERTPNAVVFPLNTEEVSAIIKICAKHKLKIIPFVRSRQRCVSQIRCACPGFWHIARGPHYNAIRRSVCCAASSHSRTCQTTGITINLQRMNKLKAVHVSDMDAVVEPGISWNELNAGAHCCSLLLLLLG